MAQIYIAGIDTNVGKTHASAALCAASGYDYFKLVQAGNPRDCEIIQKLVPSCNVLGEGIMLKTPASPHIAKALEKREYDGLEITLPSSENLIIELAGGLYTPLDERSCMIDFMRKNRRECVLVGRYYLGCINHILLSISALKASSIPILCILMCVENVGAKDMQFAYIDSFIHSFTLTRDISIIHLPYFDVGAVGNEANDTMGKERKDGLLRFEQSVRYLKKEMKGIL